jgi:hypothetical protein
MAPNFKKLIDRSVKPITNITKKGLEPIMKIFKMIKGLGKVFSNLLKPIMKILKGISKAFLSIFYYIKCAIERMKNSPKCIIYYVIDTIFFTLLIPVRILILIFPALEELEEMFREAVQKIDVIVHRISMSTIGKGVHINKWPDGVLNKCYRCQAKYDDPEGFEDFMTKLFTYNGNTKNFFFFFLNAITFFIVGFLIYANFFKRTSTCTKTKDIDIPLAQQMKP